MDNTNMNEMQVNFIAPFATGAIINPSNLKDELYRQMQNAFLKVLTSNLEIPFKPIKLPIDTQKRTIFSPSSKRNVPAYPTVLLEAKLADQEIETLNALYHDSGENISTSYICRTSKKEMPEFQIEIRTINIRIYHYGFGNLTISTIVKFPDNFSVNGACLDNDDQKIELEQAYINLRDFIEDCAETNKREIKYDCPIVAQFLPLIKKIRNQLDTERQMYLNRYTKDYHRKIRELSKQIIVNKKGFLWVHQLLFIPIPSNKEKTARNYGYIARRVFGKDTKGTKVRYLSHKECNIAYVSEGNSFALVHDMLPLSSNSNCKEEATKYIDENLTTSSLTRVIQTVGVLDAATIDLVFSLDLSMNLYTNNNNYGKQQDDKDITIENSVERISHIRTMIYQYHFSLPLVGKRIFDAIEKEWNMIDRYNYINWKFDTLEELHDRKSKKRLNRTTFVFSVIAAIGVLLSLFAIAQDGEKLPKFTIDLSGSLFTLFLVPVVFFLLLKIWGSLIWRPLTRLWKIITMQVKKIFTKSHLYNFHMPTKSASISIINDNRPFISSLALFLIFFWIIIPLFFFIIFLGDLIFDFDVTKSILDKGKLWR